MTAAGRRVLGGLTRVREFAGPDFRRYLAATTVSTTGALAAVPILAGVALASHFHQSLGSMTGAAAS